MKLVVVFLLVVIAAAGGVGGRRHVGGHRGGRGKQQPKTWYGPVKRTDQCRLVGMPNDAVEQGQVRPSSLCQDVRKTLKHTCTYTEERVSHAVRTG